MELTRCAALPCWCICATLAERCLTPVLLQDQYKYKYNVPVRLYCEKKKKKSEKTFLIKFYGMHAFILVLVLYSFMML